MKSNGTTRRRPGKAPAFAKRAERALHRAARKLHAENRKLGLPLILWQDGKVVEKPA